MSESPLSQETVHPPPTNGLSAFHARIDDLLDDVTTPAGLTNDSAPTAPTQSLVAPALSPSSTRVSSLFTPLPESTPGASSPSPAADAGAPLPGERLVSAPRRLVTPASSTNLPPFLVQPAPAPPSAPGESSPPAAPSVGEVASSSAASESNDALAPANQLVNIKGRSDGITVEVGRGSWSDILGALTKRLEQSAGFFRNGSVALDVGARPVVEDELRQFAVVLTQFEMKLGVVRTSSERTFQAALATGLTATLESPEGAPVAAATTAAANTDTASYFVYRGYLRSGHRLRRTENILVIGDINPGAEVISEGDILVWGRLRGVVHAGVGGNRRAIVAALDLEPTQMRIADVMTIGPDPKPGQPGRFFWKRSQHKRPEIARLVQNEIVLEEWDAARPGGLVSLRREAG
ncbi:MAG TPA: septum site-determining protein MinC [Chloroflexi bacterium]|nr:septum site-determining protein MinC [Chloroflexota bacterium]